MGLVGFWVWVWVFQPKCVTRPRDNKCPPATQSRLPLFGWTSWAAPSAACPASWHWSRPRSGSAAPSGSRASSGTAQTTAWHSAPRCCWRAAWHGSGDCSPSGAARPATCCWCCCSCACGSWPSRRDCCSRRGLGHLWRLCVACRSHWPQVFAVGLLGAAAAAVAVGWFCFGWLSWPVGSWCACCLTAGPIGLLWVNNIINNQNGSHF